LHFGRKAKQPAEPAGQVRQQWAETYLRTIYLNWGEVKAGREMVVGQ